MSKKEEETIPMYVAKWAEQPTARRNDWSASPLDGVATYGPEGCGSWTAEEQRAYNATARHSDLHRRPKRAKAA